MLSLETDAYQIEWDGRCVWINDHTGCCIGRFTRNGVDVHRTGPEQIATGQQCLDCFHDTDPSLAWSRFVDSMRIHHRVNIPANAKPSFVVS